MSPLNLDRIQSWIDQGRLDPSKPITMKELNDSRCLHGVKKDGVKLLARVSLQAMNYGIHCHLRTLQFIRPFYQQYEYPKFSPTALPTLAETCSYH